MKVVVRVMEKLKETGEGVSTKPHQHPSLAKLEVNFTNVTTFLADPSLLNVFF